MPFLRRRSNYVEGVTSFTMAACLGIACLFFMTDKFLQNDLGIKRDDIQTIMLVTLGLGFLLQLGNFMIVATPVWRKTPSLVYRRAA